MVIMSMVNDDQQKVEEIEDVGDEVDENTPNPT